MKTSHYLSCDLGAESGRVMLGTLEAGTLALEEIHRFPNVPIRFANSTRWDITGIFQEIKIGFAKAAAKNLPLRSVSVDSWGVDYAWVGANQPLLSLPFIYRDTRIDSAFEQACKAVEPARIFEQTGLQFLAFNTVFQLFADQRDSPALLETADCFLPIADYLNFLLCGKAVCEESLASTTQIYNPETRSWSADLISAFGFPERVFPEIVPSGTKLGPLQKFLREETGIGETDVVATCSHDTGAAVAAVPASAGTDWAFLSSGTWSLIGVELEKPLINAKVLEANFTNEGGFGGTTRFLKNITGLWILQECRREWEREGAVADYEEITALAGDAEPLRSLIDPEDPRFLKPGAMREKISDFCKETGQPVPESQGAFARCVLESLALTYRTHLDTLESLTGRQIRTLHIVGGGSRSRLLNQFAADATGKKVLSGPTEATAIGNLLIQALVAGEIADLSALRSTVAKSFPIEPFEPSGEATWDQAVETFSRLRTK